MGKRISLPQEPIAEKEAVEQYDKGAKRFMVPEYRYFVRKILSKGKKRGKVLDIGTGSGLLALELADMKGNDFDIVAIDVSANMLGKARENAFKAGQDDKIKFLMTNGAALPFCGDSFDLVISYASLHHWFEPVLIFNEIERVTKDTGVIIIRDNKRIYQNPLLRFGVWIVSRFMNEGHRTIWQKAMLASYTVPEVKEIISKSRLRDCHVNSDFMRIDLCIESLRR